MILAKRTYTRPSPDVPWHFEVVTTGLDDFKIQMTTVYPTASHNSQDIDSNTIEFMSFWDTMEEYTAYSTDPILKVFWDARDEYNRSVNITSVGEILEF
jgi:hypothetical protein